MREENKHYYKGNDRSRDERDQYNEDEKYIVEGRNAVLELIKSTRHINKIIVSNGELHGSINRVIQEAKDKKVLVQFVDRAKLDSVSRTGNHQGIIAYVAAYKYFEVDDILEKAASNNESPFVIILDEIEDPHNLGALIRTANCVGAHGVIIPKHRSAPLTETVAKSSAGAIEHTMVARVTNLDQTIEYLKEKGLWIAGADMAGKEAYFEADLKGPIGIVVGSEGKGISRLLKQKCDFLINIPLKGKVDSLNASVAGSIIMYEIVRQRLLQN